MDDPSTSRMSQYRPGPRPGRPRPRGPRHARQRSGARCRRASLVSNVAAAALLSLGCQSLLGLDDYEFEPVGVAGPGGTPGSTGAGYGGGGGTIGGNGGGASSSGAGGMCTPGREGCTLARACEPDARRCADNTPEVCSADGSSWQNDGAPCTGATPACLEPTGRCGSCTAEQRQCDGDVPQRCEGGAWVSEAACSGETPSCYAAGAVCGCIEGATRCTASNDREACQAGTWAIEPCSVQCAVEDGVAACGRVTRVAAGNDHTCALLSTGSVRCFGAGIGDGVSLAPQLGYGGTEDVGAGSGMSPTVASGAAAVFAFSEPERAERISVGRNHACVRSSSGFVHCWGENSDGQLGLGHTAAFAAMSPAVDFGDGETATEIATGENHSCAITSTPSTGGVRCWGYNGYGQLGMGHVESVGCGGDCPSYPLVSDGIVVNFSQTERAVQLVAGAYHSCAILSSGGTRCWGQGGFGQLGQGNALNVGDVSSYVSGVPNIDFGPGLSAVQISAGSYHTCAVLAPGGGVRCWGAGQVGRLGNGGEDNVGAGEPSVYPTVAEAPDVNFGAGVSATQVAAGASHTCALLATGGVRCWGSGTYGELGIAASPAFIAVGTGADVNFGPGVTAIEIASGYSHTCAILSTGALRCWGLNDKGQLGYGHTSNVGDDESPLVDVQFF